MLNQIEQDNVIDQIRELDRRIESISEVVTSIDRTAATTADEIVPAMVNFIDNSDFTYSDHNYNATSYTDDTNVLANFYGRAQATNSSYVENTSSAESTESVRRSSHSGGRRTGFLWNDTEGSLLLTGGYRIGARIPAKYAFAGNYMASRLQVSFHDVSFTFAPADVNTGTERITHASHGLANATRVRLTTTGTLPSPLQTGTDYYIVGTAANDFQLSSSIGGAAINLTDTGSGTHTLVPMIYEDIKLKISLWDNTANEILKGTQPTLTLTKIGSHPSGTVKREYILEVVMPDGRTFYSDTVTPANVTNTVPTTTVDETNYVTIEWAEVTGSARYRLYRRTPLEANTSWYLVETITNGSTAARDFGGVGGGVWTIPTLDNDHKQYQRAEAFIDDIGEALQTANSILEAAVGIQVPYNFSVNGNQFLQVEFLKSDYSNTTNAEIPADSLRIDRVGLSYTNGRWVASSRDLTKLTATTGTPAPPPSGGGGGSNPPSGGGGSTCVREDCGVLVWSDSGNHYYLPASKIVVGDRLVSWDEKLKCLAPSLVYKVITGISRANHLVYAQDRELPCSFSHRVITDFDDFSSGTRVTHTLNGTLMYLDDSIKVTKIDSVETINDTWTVKTFVLQKNRRNYIANGFFSHNLKPLE